MRRRRALQLIGASVAAISGCLDNEQRGTSETEAESPEYSTESDDSGNPFQFETAVTNATPTEQRPPIIRISVTNSGESPHLLTISEESFPFATSEATTTDSSLVLATETPPSRETDCWRGVPRSLPMISGQKFSPGESVTAEYAVLNEADTDNCWPPKTFEFTETYYLDPENTGTTEGGTQFEWGFSIVVTEDAAITLRDRRSTTDE